MNGFQMTYTVIGGLGIFILGIKYLSESLQSMAGDLLRRTINLLTSKPIMAVLVGTFVTAIIQSSSITTVMVVGMVNAGLMNLTQAIGVIYGANIGTTITAWIIAVKVGKYGLLFLGLGAFPMMFSKNEHWKAIGKLFVALGFVFIGLKYMSDAFTPLRTDPTFLSYLQYFTADSYLSLWGCILVGCLLTCIVQSSSAMIGITIALAGTGAITFQTAMALVIGQNIGTTITANLAAIGTNTNAKRAAHAHALFNIFGAVFMSFIFWWYIGFVDMFVAGNPNMLDAMGNKPNIATHIAMGHTIFNVVITIVFMFLIKPLAKLVTWITPSNKERDKFKSKLKVLGPTPLAPALALEQAQQEIAQMLDTLKKLLLHTRDYLSLDQDDNALLDKIVQMEGHFDVQQKDVTVFLCHVMEEPLSPEQAALGYGLIRTSDEIESVSDYCSSIAKLYKKTLTKEDSQLSVEAKSDIRSLYKDVMGFYDVIRRFFDKRDLDLVEEYQLKSRQIHIRADRTRKNHMERIRSANCPPLSGLVFSDMIVASRRITNHTVNIMDAVASTIPNIRAA
ncbi:Na/Pi cotransporter family protein [bacterium]|nr:Na/Pi cotransporter family protein [bacterium]